MEGVLVTDTNDKSVERRKRSDCTYVQADFPLHYP